MPSELHRANIHAGTVSWTRRQFLKSAVGVSATSALAGCTVLGLEDEEEPLFDGPAIDEKEFTDFNARYYDIAIDENTQFPNSFIRSGVPSGETDPVSIAYRLQYLLDQVGRAPTIETILDHLLLAQVDDQPPRNYRNMLPRLAFTVGEPGFEPATRDYSFVHNALLSSRVAMAAEAFRGTRIETLALTYLERQKEGYNRVLAQTDSGFLPVFANAGLFGVDPEGMNLLFGGFWDAVAFVLSYFIGGTQHISDPEVGPATWRAMIDAQNTYAGEHPASTTASVTLHSPLARNGSAFQYFQPLLSLDADALSPSMAGALYNVLFSFLDAAVYDRVPGIYSAGPHAGGFLVDNGLNRLAARQRNHGSQESIVTIDALAAAMRLFAADSDERLTLRGWIALYASVQGSTGPRGYYSGMSKDGTPVTAMYARQNGAMILFNSTASSYLDGFLAANDRPTLRSLVSNVELTYNGSPIQRVQSPLPLPIRHERLFTFR